MKLKLATIAAGMALMAVSITVKAQKAYNEGVITYTVTTPRGTADAKTYFKADSNITVTQTGPATIKVLSVGTGDYLAVLVDVPVASMKKAAVATPAELEQFMSTLPDLSFTPTTETKQIAGLNCKKVTAKDSKDGSTFDVWITNDISTPINGISQLYGKAGGFPVQFTTVQMGQKVAVAFKSITDEKAPAGTFKVPANFDKISLTDLQGLFAGQR